MVAATTAYRTQNAKMGCYQSGPTYRKEPRNSAISRCFWAFNYIYACIKDCVLIDQACGTGGMLSTGYNFIKRYNPSADVRLFGQEINPESYAMCLAEMLIKGQNAENICYQDTMKADRFKSTKMRFVLENPPFGTAWGGKDAAEGVEDAVNAEYQKGFDGRWGAGLPGSGDMQMLLLQSAIDKMDDNFGRAAIIENGSPLFSGGTASGESQIRRWMLENDLIEAIIALPTDLFYNTGIATYIWVLSKNKRPERKGKIQLIDASTFFKKLRKALGDKKNEISPEDRSAVTKLYADFAENEYCKIYRNEEFIYREYTVMQPLQRSYAITQERIEAMLSKGALSSLYDQVKVDELENAEELTGKDQKKLETYQANQPVYEAIIAALNAYDVMKVFYNMGNGVRQGLNYSEFSRLMVFEPPYEEQVAMADYLETKGTEVDAIIEQKKE